ncbi:MAG TPA: hypothetical protein PLP42_19510 [Acidobacteriota bacterium]|nr:hypothetical protein [Acidobacteriota bacterium]
MRAQRGEGRFGCVVTLLLLFVFGLACFRCLPVFLDKMDFEDQLERIASEGGSRGWDAESVKHQIRELAKVKQFEMAPEDLRVLTTGRPGGELRIDVKYSRTVDLAGYSYTFRFHTQAKSFVGTL